jgi:hypothetical protein
MKLTRLAFALALLTACQTDSTSTTTETEQAIGGDFCNAKFPALTVWNGKPPPQISSGRFVLLKSQQYTGWWLLSLVDTSVAKIPYAVWVHDTQLNQMASYLIRAGLVGPGGGPVGPPCELPGACSKYVVALAQRVEVAPFEAYQDAMSCGQN